MLDLGFSGQILSILGRVRPDAQTLLFSATLSGREMSFARRAGLLSAGAVTVRVGSGVVSGMRGEGGMQYSAKTGVVSADVTEHYHVLQDEDAKRAWLRSFLLALAMADARCKVGDG